MKTCDYLTCEERPTIYVYVIGKRIAGYCKRDARVVAEILKLDDKHHVLYKKSEAHITIPSKLKGSQYVKQ